MPHFNSSPIDTDELVINWHITESCNYRCRFCFSAWSHLDCRELWQERLTTSRILKELRDFFDPANSCNPLHEQMHWNSVRLSLAGGEPTLLGMRLADIAREAKDFGFRVSLITNGSQLDTTLLYALAPNLTVLGLSVDSLQATTNIAVGRALRDTVLTLDDIVAITEVARTANPALAIKINTVVNKANAEEDLSILIDRVRPMRWKVLRMLPVITDDLAVDHLAFSSFVARHGAFSAVMCSEDNDEMAQSYVMIDPYGRFFQNVPDSGNYLYSSPISDIGPANAFAQVPFASKKFAARYRMLGAQRS